VDGWSGGKYIYKKSSVKRKIRMRFRKKICYKNRVFQMGFAVVEKLKFILGQPISASAPFFKLIF
jgi:hypothetical protein